MPVLRNIYVPVSNQVGVVLSEIAASETAEIVEDEKRARNLRREWKGVFRGNSWVVIAKKNIVNRVIPTKSAEKTSQSKIIPSTNVSHQSLQKIFGTNLSWHVQEILAGRCQNLLIPRTKNLSCYLARRELSIVGCLSGCQFLR